MSGVDVSVVKTGFEFEIGILIVYVVANCTWYKYYVYILPLI